MSVRNIPGVPIFLLCLLFMTAGAHGQDKPNMQAVQHAYEQFDYTQTVVLAQTLLSGGDTLSNAKRVTVLTLKGVAEFSLGREDSSRATFLSLLSLDPTNSLDPVAYSPKIVDFFEQVKKQFIPNQTVGSPVTAIPKPDESDSQTSSGTVLKSILLPGSGQLSSEDSGTRAKGWIFASVAVTSFAASIYYIIQTNKAESDYLSQNDRTAISSSYDSYNSAYTKRNISIIIFAAAWSAAQLDLLYLSPQIHPSKTSTVQLSFLPFTEPGVPLLSPSISARFSF